VLESKNIKSNKTKLKKDMANPKTSNPNAVHFADTETLIHSKIDPSSTIHGGVMVEDDLEVGPFATIHQGATVSGKIGERATVGANAKVTGSSLGYSSEVEPNAKVSDSTLGNKAIVLKGAEIDSSTVGYASEIGIYSKVDSSKVGEGVIVGSRAKLNNGSIVLDGADVAAGETIPTNGVRISKHHTVV
jgi:UDP-3-O-[3-hydroxymyristoyl] glucosamine N-acyltransferase